MPIDFLDTLSASVARVQTRWAGWVSGFAVGSGVVVTVDYVATSLGSPGEAATVCALNDESWEGRVSVVDPGHGIALIEGVEGLPGLRFADSPAAAPPGAEIALLGYTPSGWRSSAGTMSGRPRAASRRSLSHSCRPNSKRNAARAVGRLSIAQAGSSRWTTKSLGLGSSSCSLAESPVRESSGSAPRIDPISDLSQVLAGEAPTGAWPVAR